MINKGDNKMNDDLYQMFYFKYLYLKKYGNLDVTSFYEYLDKLEKDGIIIINKG